MALSLCLLGFQGQLLRVVTEVHALKRLKDLALQVVGQVLDLLLNDLEARRAWHLVLLFPIYRFYFLLRSFFQLGINNFLNR